MNRKTTTFYKLKHAFDETKEFYIGSTDNYKQRIWQHRYGSSPQPKLYRYIARNGGFDSWTFEVLEEHKSMDKYDRYRKEAQLIEHHKATLNTNIPDSALVDVTDERKQVCGRCGCILSIYETSKSKLKKHWSLKRCQNAPPPVIVKGNNNTINISYMKGKKPIIIEGDNNTINIHY
jgi:predicted GIY-YIG superfamily endonuclease